MGIPVSTGTAVIHILAVLKAYGLIESFFILSPWRRLSARKIIQATITQNQFPARRSQLLREMCHLPQNFFTDSARQGLRKFSGSRIPNSSAVPLARHTQERKSA